MVLESACNSKPERTAPSLVQPTILAGERTSQVRCRAKLPQVSKIEPARSALRACNLYTRGGRSLLKRLVVHTQKFTDEVRG